MPIHYDVETDGLYLEGYKKGFEIGLFQTEAAIRMLRHPKLTLADIMYIMDVPESFVRRIAEEIGIDIHTPVDDKLPID